MRKFTLQVQQQNNLYIYIFFLNEWSQQIVSRKLSALLKRCTRFD